MKRSIKIDHALLEQVEVRGKASQRTAAAQTEYLIKLGLQIEESREASIQRYERSLAAVLSRDFSSRVRDHLYSMSEFTYVASLKGADYVDRLYLDGTRVTGKLSDNEFVEC
jgi:hypothetical protein